MAKRRTEKPLWRRITGMALYGVLCLSAVAIGAGYSWIRSSDLLWAMFKQRVFNIEPPAPQEVFRRDAVNVLVLGCDEDRVYGRRKPIREKARSDMMLVARVDFKQKRITGVSIPRDTLVAVPGYREQKINAYHAIGLEQGGEEAAKQLAKQASEQLIGVSIDRVIVVDYDSLQQMVNLVGGVELFVEKRMEYHDRAGGLHIDLKPGKQKLDGYKAMGYVRFRHDRGSDFARQERQKNFLLAFRSALNKNIVMLPEVLNKAIEAMGGGLSQTEVESLAMFAQKIGGDNIRFGQIPVVDAPNYNLRVDAARLPQTLAEFHLIEGSLRSSGLSYHR